MKNLDDETMVNRSANYNNNEDTVVKDEETLLNDKETDDTMYDDDEDTNPAFRDDKEYNEVPQQKSGWKKVVMGGVAGIVLGSGGVILSGSASALNDPDAPKKDEDDDHNITPLPNNPDITVEDLPVATTVNDDMNFGEAFAAARQEVGPGGVFEWHGGVYGTYYADEWDKMTPEEQAEFGRHINYGGVGHQQEEPVATVDPQEPELNVDPEEPQIINVSHEQQEAEVQILGVSNETLEDGSQVTIGHLQQQGDDVYVVDVNQNGQFDILMHDDNGDGVITSDEVYDITDQNLSVASLQQQSAMQNGDYLAQNNQPDYINDANPSEFNA